MTRSWACVVPGLFLMAVAQVVLAQASTEKKFWNVIVPSEADAAIMAGTTYDVNGWNTFKKATLTIWDGGVKSVMAQAYILRKGKTESVYKSLDTLTKFYSTPPLRIALDSAGMSPQQYAIWDKGLNYYRTSVLVAKGFTGNSIPLSTTGGHDANYKFVLEHFDEINDFFNQLTVAASEGSVEEEEE